jgi:hypothetical protein
MYDFLPEKSLRLAKFYGIGETFILAIWILFTRASNEALKSRIFYIFLPGYPY